MINCVAMPELGVELQMIEGIICDKKLISGSLAHLRRKGQLTKLGNNGNCDIDRMAVDERKDTIIIGRVFGNKCYQLISF